MKIDQDTGIEETQGSLTHDGFLLILDEQGWTDGEMVYECRAGLPFDEFAQSHLLGVRLSAKEGGDRYRDLFESLQSNALRAAP